jgi:hypothetical protein
VPLNAQGVHPNAQWHNLTLPIIGKAANSYRSLWLVVEMGSVVVNHAVQPGIGAAGPLFFFAFVVVFVIDPLGCIKDSITATTGVFLKPRTINQCREHPSLNRSRDNDCLRLISDPGRVR